MLSLFTEYPIITVIAVVAATALLLFLKYTEPQLGEILGMQRVFPFLVLFVMAILWIGKAIGKAFLPQEAKKRKNRARATKAQSGKD